LSGEVHDMLWANGSFWGQLSAQPLFAEPLTTEADKRVRQSSQRGVPLVPRQTTPPWSGLDRDSASPELYEDDSKSHSPPPHERIGSLVVWQRCGSPASQVPTTVPNSPSPDIPSAPSSRPPSRGAMYQGSGRPNSAAQRPRVVKDLPFKFRERETCLVLDDGPPKLSCQAQAVRPSHPKPSPRLNNAGRQHSAKAAQDVQTLNGEHLPAITDPAPLPQEAALAAAQAALVAAGNSPFANIVSRQTETQKVAAPEPGFAARPRSGGRVIRSARTMVSKPEQVTNDLLQREK